MMGMDSDSDDLNNDVDVDDDSICKHNKKQ